MRVACDIRTRVFVDEQGVPLADEFDAHDRTDMDAVHALAYDQAGAPIGAGRYYVPEPGTAQIGRMSVLPYARGSGAGAALLQALMADARRRGLTRVHLYAQVAARGFYLKAGFHDDGALFWDAGIEHQPMTSALA